MLESVAATGGGMDRTKPISGLDELLTMSSKASKEIKSLATAPGDSSFERMLTEDLQLRQAAPSRSTTTGDTQIAKPVAQKTQGADAKKIDNKSEADKDSKDEKPPGEPALNLNNSLLTAVPVVTLNGIAASSVATAGEGRDESLPTGDAVAGLLLNDAADTMANLAAPAPTAPITDTMANLAAPKPTAPITDTIANLATPKPTAPNADNMAHLAATKPAAPNADNMASLAATKPAAPNADNLASLAATKPAAPNADNLAPLATTAIIAGPKKITLADKRSIEPPAETKSKEDENLTKVFRDALGKVGAVEFTSPRGETLKGDVKKDSVLSDKARPHAQESVAAADIMDITANRAAAPLGKGQDTTVTTHPCWSR